MDSPCVPGKVIEAQRGQRPARSYFGIHGDPGHLQVSRADCCRGVHSAHSWGLRCCADRRRHHGPRRGAIRHQVRNSDHSIPQDGAALPLRQPVHPPLRIQLRSQLFQPPFNSCDSQRPAYVFVCVRAHVCTRVCPVSALLLWLGFYKRVPCTWTPRHAPSKAASGRCSDTLVGKL